MRIFYSTLHWFPPRLVDVVELFGIELARRGVVTEWYAQRGEPGPRGVAYLHGQAFSLPLNLAPNKGPIKLINKMLYWFFDWVTTLGKIRNPPDIFQARDKYVGALAGLFAARLTNRKFVYWMSYPFPEHDLEMAQAIPFPRSMGLRLRGELGRRVLYRFIMRHADHVFVQSEQMKRDVASYGISPGKMTPVPMGVTEQVFHQAGCDNIETVSGRVVYLGTLAKVRRMETLIQAMQAVVRQVPSAHLFMIGDGNHPSERAFLEAEAERLGLRNHVTFTGFLPMEDAWKIVKSAQLCVSPIYPTPTLRAGSPTKLVEYLALGKPVVVNDHPEQSEIIADSGGGLCVTWSPEAFADAIVRLLQNPEEALVMGARGPAWVAANRTYDKLAAQVHVRYLELLSGEA